MNRLRNRLILIFLAATLAPLAATVWITTSLLEWRWRLDSAATAKLEELSSSLEQTGKELYQRERDDLKRRAQRGDAEARKFLAADQANWPEKVKAFANSDEADAFVVAVREGNELDYLIRRGEDVWSYTASLGSVELQRLTDEIRGARDLVHASRERDPRRALKLSYILMAAGIWVIALALLIFLADRISRPIQQLTAGLAQLAAGDLNARVSAERDDEVGRAIQAFNHMAGKLKEGTERLVYLRQLESWQSLARKMAHEVKNSLTPIRLTVEEMFARHNEPDRGFLEQAKQIVVDEIETLERRVRSFSQFAAEPPVQAAPLDVNSLLQERIAFLKTAHPEVAYDCRLTDLPRVIADQDLVKGILTNLLENAAEAAGAGGRILGLTSAEQERVAIEVHDSGPGLTDQERASLFQPTISFKKKGMGLGLSIARKSALLSGGDIVLVKGELGGAGFRVLLPMATNGIQARSDRG